VTDYNASDTRQIRAAIKRSKTDRALDDGVLLALMTTPNGRAWMWRFLSRLHAFHTPYTGDNNATNFQCGEHNVGLELINDLLRACPDQYIFMMREANDGQRSDTSTDSGQRGGTEDTGRDDSAPDGRVERDTDTTSDSDSGPGDATI
jgi:hypothetical protein